jgi:hypothetical protein
MAVLAVLAALAGTSCKGSADSASSAAPSTPVAGAPVGGAHTSPKPKPKPKPRSEQVRPAPPAALHAACPLLRVSDLRRLLGSGSHTQVVATEDHTEVPHGNSVSHMCLYGKPGANAAFSLDVQTHAHPVLSPAQVIANVVKAAQAPTHRVSGVGEAATFYTLPDGVSTMTAAKRSAGQVRIVIFLAPRVVPEEKFISVEKLVLSRI